MSFRLPIVPFLLWPVLILASLGLLSLRSKGPGAIVFIRCSRPPEVAVRGLTGAYLGSASANFPIPPYPPPVFDRIGAFCFVGKGGNAQSRFEESGSGDGVLRIIGAVPLRIGRPKGDWRPSFGVIGDALLDGDKLTGVSWSCRKYGRSRES